MAETKQKEEIRKKPKGEGKKPKAEEKKRGKAEKAAQAEEAIEYSGPRLKAFFRKDVVPALMREFNYANPYQVPRLGKITLNMGLGEATQNPKIIESGAAELTAIAGQKPVVTKARKSIATFKLRQGVPIGCKVTLRGHRMYEFFDRLVSVALPRVRDFKGLSPKSFDGRGSYTFGIKEQIIFPEIHYDKVEKIKGLNVTICTSARTDDEARALLRHLGMPFR